MEVLITILDNMSIIAYSWGMETLALRLRQLREDRQLTLRALADRAEVSASALSQIEKGLVSPSIATLERICNGLGLHITALFDEPSSDAPPLILRAGKRRKVYSLESRASIEPLARDLLGKKMQPLLVTLEPGGECGEHPYASAEGEEFAMVISGTAYFEQQGKRYTLQAGDAVYYDPRLLHNWHNSDPTPAVLLIVVAQ